MPRAAGSEEGPGVQHGHALELGLKGADVAQQPLLLDDMQLLNAPFKILAHALVFHLVRCEALALLLRALPACESGGKSYKNQIFRT